LGHISLFFLLEEHLNGRTIMTNQPLSNSTAQDSVDVSKNAQIGEILVGSTLLVFGILMIIIVCYYSRRTRSSKTIIAKEDLPVEKMIQVSRLDIKGIVSLCSPNLP
jgi:hypothetical protein